MARMPGKYDKAVSDYIDQFWEDHFCGPSVHDIIVGTGISYHALMWQKRDFPGMTFYRDTFIPSWVREAITYTARIRREVEEE